MTHPLFADPTMPAAVPARDPAPWVSLESSREAA